MTVQTIKQPRVAPQTISPVIPIAKQIHLKALPFTKQYGFRKTLNERVDAFVEANHIQTRDIPAMYVKSVVVLLWWAASYGLLLYGGWQQWHGLALAALALSFGLAVACIGFNIMHDANHGGYSDNPKINRFLGMSAELVGLSGFIWRQQHNVWHHTYTNIAGMDEGLETEGWIRSSPKDVWQPKHRYQHLYAPIVYAFAGVGLLLLRNYIVYFTGKSSEHFVYPTWTRKDKIQFWIGRALNMSMYFVIPFFIFTWWNWLLLFIVLAFTGGFTMATILMLAHVSHDVEFPEPTGDPLRIENEWAIHQVVTTMNFSPKNAALNWYVGGLNYQIEHHLYPQFCHMVYPKIAHIVRDTCQEFGVAYRSEDSFFKALKDHYISLKEFGKMPTV
jgi:linoleoyl-CoA desaturase